MTDEDVDETLPPQRRRLVARGFWSLGIVICLFVGAAIVTGTSPRAAAGYLPPGLLAIGFSLFLQWSADLDEDGDRNAA